MPIYAYKCGSCGYAKDVLQKMSAAPLTVCPSCGAEAFSKQVTAAGFQLKGSGWYVTDFRGGSNTGAPAAEGQGAPAAGDKKAAADTAPASAPAADAAPAGAKAPAAAAPAPAPAPAASNSSN